MRTQWLHISRWWWWWRGRQGEGFVLFHYREKEIRTVSEKLQNVPGRRALRDHSILYMGGGGSQEK